MSLLWERWQLGFPPGRLLSSQHHLGHSTGRMCPLVQRDLSICGVEVWVWPWDLVFLGLSSLMCDQTCPTSPKTGVPSLPWSCWLLFPVLGEWSWQGWPSGWRGICQGVMLSGLTPLQWIVGCPPLGKMDLPPVRLVPLAKDLGSYERDLSPIQPYWVDDLQTWAEKLADL